MNGTIHIRRSVSGKEGIILTTCLGPPGEAKETDTSQFNSYHRLLTGIWLFHMGTVTSRQFVQKLDLHSFQSSAQNQTGLVFELGQVNLSSYLKSIKPP